MSARARKVFDLLVEEGSLSTHDIEVRLGEAHAPRAVADLKDAGIPVVQEGYVTVDGRRRGLYHLDPAAPLRAGMTGRTGFSSAFKKRLLKHYGTKCVVCGVEYDPRFLQPDHRVPVMVAGDEADAQRDLANYMPLCRSCNRTKSFECEGCPNGLTERDADVCRTCFWGSPEDYLHVATREERRETIVWRGRSEVVRYEELVARAKSSRQVVPDYILRLLADD